MVRGDPADPYRLGPRRNARDYSVHQRRTGLCALDRGLLRDLDERRRLLAALYMRRVRVERVAAQMFGTDAVVAPQTKRLRLLWLHAEAAARELRRPRLVIPTHFPKTRIATLDHFDDGVYTAMFGFTKEQVQALMDAMVCPARLVMQAQQGKSRWHVSFTHALLYSLYRIHSPVERQELDNQGKRRARRFHPPAGVFIPPSLTVSSAPPSLSPSTVTQSLGLRAQRPFPHFQHLHRVDRLKGHVERGARGRKVVRGVEVLKVRAGLDEIGGGVELVEDADEDFGVYGRRAWLAVPKVCADRVSDFRLELGRGDGRGHRRLALEKRWKVIA